MDSTGNNTDWEISHVRDSYFDSGEQEYLEQLLKDPKEREIHSQLMKVKVERLYKKAQKLMMAVEGGEYDEHQMAVAEYKLTHILAAIDDMERFLVLERVQDSGPDRPTNPQYNYNVYSNKKQYVAKERDLFPDKVYDAEQEQEDLGLTR